MKTRGSIWQRLAYAGVLIGLALTNANPAIAATASAADYAAYPPLVKSGAAPRVMLVMSRDNQLFRKAYSDYTDLNGDGVLDTTYKDSITYYGYFNSDFCYSYSGGVFNPDGQVAAGTHQCSGEWSGNFLNWASMTRMDIVRRVLYGGKRSTDTTSSTILERAMIPWDNHAFVKVYSGSDTDKYTPYDGTISLCNVTDGSGRSGLLDTSLYPPMMKVVKGSWPQWASSEVTECQYKGTADSPSTAYRYADYIVRVAACVSGQDANASYCRSYTDSSTGTVTKKPAGILQEHGEDGSIDFGLMTGSYNKKATGGVLRKNALPLAGNSDTSKNEINLNNGEFTGNDGIIETLNTLRIAGYDYDTDKYDDCDTYGISVTDFLTSTDSGKQCRDWGDPLAEIYLETLRYLAGLSATSAYVTDDSTWLPGLETATWQDPLDKKEPCAQCAIIVLSTGLNTFDGDDLSNLTGLPDAKMPGGTMSNSPDAWTQLVGDLEGINGHDYIASNVGSGTISPDLCTTETITNLADVTGICPQVPQLQGTYKVDGLAYYAHLADLRQSTDFPGTQNVDTYAVSLAPSLPSFEFKAANGNTVSLVPSCQSNQSYGWSDCSLADVRVEKQTPYYSRILISWDDSHWGNDHDMDGMSMIEVCTATGDRATVTSECPLYGTNGTIPDSGGNYMTQDFHATTSSGEVQVRVSVPQAAAGLELRFGYVMNGSSSQDGLHDDLYRPGGYNFSCLQDPSGTCSPSSDNILWENPVAYSAASTNGALLKNPLWYAAKYGNFTDLNGDRKPTSDSGDTSEWDVVNNLTGSTGADGLPDSFFPVSNPSLLGSRLNTVLSDIRARVSSGTSVAVTLERSDGVGASFQAYYYPRFDQTGTSRSVNWVGGMQALFVDSQARLREDTNHDDTLTNADYVVNLVYDSSLKRTVAKRYDPVSGAYVDTVPLSKLNKLWDARDQLASLTTAQVVNQRSPYNDTSGDRYIFTWIDRNKDGVVDDTTDPSTNEVLPFTPATFDSNGFWRYLDVADQATADKVVDWIRGEEISGMRNRTIDFGKGNEVWRLGDILDSSPEVVAVPGANYDVLYRDSTYGAFRQHYLHRRQVVYVGANDGMLHAFNAGFYISGSKKFAKTYSSGDTAYALGSELWAYVPYDLLPHLQWLTQPNYPHVYYVDGPPKAYDVNMFPADSTHINGWGTILVVTMRFGGGDISIDTTGNGVDDTTMRSAILVFDITDPEQKPKLLAEITNPELGFTTSTPALVKARAPDPTSGLFTTGGDAWYLVIGSGPFGSDAVTRRQALVNGVSNQTTKVFVYDLVNNKMLDFDSTTPGIQPLDTSIADSFAGDMRSVDWSGNYIDDDVYFGITGGTPAAPTGGVERLKLNLDLSQAQPFQYSSLGWLINPGEPVQGAPATFVNQITQDRWVIFGTGRLYTPADNGTNYPAHAYGVLENNTSSATTTATALADTTGLQIGTSGTVYDSSGNTPATVKGQSVGDFDTLKTVVHDAGGWYSTVPQLNYRNGRVYIGPVAAGFGVTYPEYYPSGNICQPEGSSDQVTVDPRTGTASSDVSFGIYDGSGNVVDSNGNVLYSQTGNHIGDTFAMRSNTMAGAASQARVLNTYGSGGLTPNLNICTSTLECKNISIQSAPVQNGRQSWRELPLHQGH